MPVPKPVGRVHYNEPRAVIVREPENLDVHHSAIHCGVNIYTDNREQAELIMRNWQYIMAALSNSIEAHIAIKEVVDS